MKHIYRLNGYKGLGGSDLRRPKFRRYFSVVKTSRRFLIISIVIVILASVQIAAAYTLHLLGHKPPSQVTLPKSSQEPPALPGVIGKTSLRPPHTTHPYGLALGDTLTWLRKPALEKEMNGIVSLGVSWIRIDVSWADVQPKNSRQYDWSALDSVIAAANAHGIRVLGTIAYTPPWAVTSSCRDKTSQKCAPASDARFAAFAFAVAKRYGSKGVHAWEVWNEPNDEGFWQPAPNAVAYAKLLQTSYTAIKRADPTALVISGSLGPLDDSARSVSQRTFLARMYAAGAKGYFDAVGYHPYSYPALPDYVASWNSWSMLAALPLSIRGIMQANGDQAKQIWITEYGAPTDGPGALATLNNFNFLRHPDHVSEALQAQMLADALTQYRSAGYFGNFFWYSYQDLGTAMSSGENFFGLLRHNGSRKPAFMTYQQAIIHG